MSLINLPVLSMSHPRTATGAYIWYNRLPQLTANEPVSQPPVFQLEQKQNPEQRLEQREESAVLKVEHKQESDWQFWFGAAAVVAAVGALVVYAVSSGQRNKAIAAIPDSPVKPHTDRPVVLKRDELLAVDMHLSCEGVNLWDMLEVSKGELEAQLIACLEECVGPGVEFRTAASGQRLLQR